MRNHNIADWIAYILLVIGGLNWGIIGAVQTNVVDQLLGRLPYVVPGLYIVIGLAAIYVIIACIAKPR